jgi:hypothetical protein
MYGGVVMNEYEGDIAEMEVTVEGLHKDLDHLNEVVTGMAGALDRIADDLEEYFECCEECCLEDSDDEETSNEEGIE